MKLRRHWDEDGKMKLAELQKLSTGQKTAGAEDGVHPSKVGFEGHQKRFMEALHRKCFPENWLAETKLEGPDYRRRGCEYLKEADARGICPDDAIRFHRAKVYDIVKRLREDCSGGQLPGTIVASNSSSDYLVHILSDGIGWVTSDRKRAGYAFGGTMNLREMGQIAPMTEDAIFTAYMLGHMMGDKSNPYPVGVIKKEGKPQADALIPYILFSCAYGSEAERNGKNEIDAIRLALERRKKYTDEWRKMGFIVCKEDDPYISLFNKKDGAHPKIYIPVILHDLRECRFYVVEKDGKKVEFAEWAERLGLTGIDIVKKHIAAIEKHADERDYFDLFTKLSAKKKEAFCVDSRLKSDIGGMAKTLGAVLNEEVMWKVLTNPTTGRIAVRLHTNCGYLTTAMKIHELGIEVRRRLDRLEEKINAGEDCGSLNVEDVRWVEKFVKNLMLEMLSKKKQKEKQGGMGGIVFDYAKFENMLNLAEGGRPMPAYLRHLLHDLLNDSLSDSRNTVRHMVGRDVLEWDSKLNTIVMVSAKKVDELVGPECPLLRKNREGKKNEAELQNAYYALVTLAFAADELDYWHAKMTKNEKQLLEGRRKGAEKAGLPALEGVDRLPTINVKIENADTGEVMIVSEWPTLSGDFKAQLDGMAPLERLAAGLGKIVLKDAITGQEI